MSEPLTPLVESRSHNITDTLYHQDENRDPVTGFPTESPYLRRQLIGLIEGAMTSGKTIGLVNADMDDLKGVNNRLGHELANHAIRKVVEDKKDLMEKSSLPMEFAAYRPQAGGDEYKFIILFDGETSDEIIEKIAHIFSVKTVFQSPRHSEENIASSFGFAICQSQNQADAGKILETLEGEAEVKQVEQKMGKIEAAIKSTVQEGSKLDVDTYINEIIIRWGAKRIGERALRVVLEHVRAKAVMQSLGQGGK